jgi:hypothetical protein
MVSPEDAAPRELAAAQYLPIARTRAFTTTRSRPSAPSCPVANARRRDSKDHMPQYQRRPGVVISGRPALRECAPVRRPSWSLHPSFSKALSPSPLLSDSPSSRHCTGTRTRFPRPSGRALDGLDGGRSARMVLGLARADPWAAWSRDLTCERVQMIWLAILRRDCCRWATSF